ncbi:MAG: SpoIIE family protein phosphatase [Verrucomicrobia bacterium]|nr:SpoIIE family protein phosphatase [Verrucomicrobiota bacterium]
MDEKPVKVLIVEDEPQFADAVADMLRATKRHRFECESAASLAAALTRLAAGGIDLVLLDLYLSDSDGLDTVVKVQTQVPQLPIIVLSGVDDETLEVEALAAGAQDYLVKGQTDKHLFFRTIRYAIERKRAELALLQAEEKYRSIFENTVEGIFQTTADGHYLSANSALARIYGYDSPEELMRAITDIARSLYVDPNRRAEFVRLMQENQIVTGFESQVNRKDGKVIWISENVRVVRDAQGRLLYYEGTVEDITERKRAEERLRDSESLYHSLVENLPQNILRKDLSERFTFANQRFCQTLGRPLEEIIGKTDYDFFPPELAAKYQQDDRQVIATGKMFETVEEHQPPGKEKLYVQVMKTPIYDAQGKIIGLQGIFWDITARKQAEERERLATAELARSQAELRKKNDQMEESLRMAREIQLAFLPQQYPTFPTGVDAKQSALSFCHRYLPAGTVGGDFFNVLALSDTQAGVFISDVMGHGVRSALITAMMRALVEELIHLAQDPGALLTQINHDLNAILKQTGSPMFASAFYLVADLKTRTLRFANAGHPKPLLLRRSTGQVELLENTERKSRPALGLIEDSVYTTSQCPLTANDLIMLYTDGLYEVEGPNQEFFGQERMLPAVTKRIHQPASQLFDELLEEIQRFALKREFDDDVCLVGMEVMKI